jgi:hypothetical protein
LYVILGQLGSKRRRLKSTAVPSLSNVLDKDKHMISPAGNPPDTGLQNKTVVSETCYASEFCNFNNSFKVFAIGGHQW